MDHLSPKLRTAWQGGTVSAESLALQQNEGKEQRGAPTWLGLEIAGYSSQGRCREKGLPLWQVRGEVGLFDGGGDGEHLLMMGSTGKWSVRCGKMEKAQERGGLGSQGGRDFPTGEHLRDDGYTNNTPGTALS